MENDLSFLHRNVTVCNNKRKWKGYAETAEEKNIRKRRQLKNAHYWVQEKQENLINTQRRKIERTLDQNLNESYGDLVNILIDLEPSESF